MGSWLSLKVLKARPHHGIERVFELFPTIHKIADTPNGRNMKVKKKRERKKEGRLRLMIVDDVLCSL